MDEQQKKAVPPEVNGEERDLPQQPEDVQEAEGSVRKEQVPEGDGEAGKRTQSGALLAAGFPSFADFSTGVKKTYKRLKSPASTVPTIVTFAMTGQALRIMRMNVIASDEGEEAVTIMVDAPPPPRVDKEILLPKKRILGPDGKPL